MQKKKRYQTLEKLSEGQFGTVFKGLDTETNQTVAIKKMYVSLKHNSPAAKNVLREIDCIKRIDHENVLKLLDYEVKETSVKLVMEYMDYDLKSFIDSMPSPLKNSKVKGIAKMILEGLKATHAQGLLHRDLKPSNILINSEGVVKIGDFGSAIHVSNTEDGKFEIEGFSRWYKAPEILYGSRSYDFRADIWSFACIYGELLNGSPMFPGINDFDQISKIIKVLGTANTENWPEMEQLPDYGKVMFSQHPAQDLNIIFPNATKSELEFVRTVLTYARPKTIDDVLANQYFQENPQPKRYKHVKIVKPDQEVRTDYQALLNLNEPSS